MEAEGQMFEGWRNQNRSTPQPSQSFLPLSYGLHPQTNEP